MTQVGYGPLARIDGPPPLAPVYGLLPAAEAPAAGVRIVTDLDSGGVPRWVNGAQVHDYPPGVGGTWDTCATGTSQTIKEDDDPLLLPEFGAYTAYLTEICTTYRIWSQDEFVQRAQMAFAAVESSIIARELMSGQGIPANPHLADGNGDFPLADVATSVINGLATLEQQIALTGKLGLIHCSPSVATIVRERFAIDDKTGVLRTVSGNVVIPDAGYANTTLQTPTGHAAPHGTQEWMFATGPIDIRRDPVGAPIVLPDNVLQAVERGTGGADTGLPNSVAYRVERFYLVDWDTQLQASVLVDRCYTGCTS